jgi:hypothetical protein
MPATETKPTPPVAAGQQYQALYDSVNTTVTELFDNAWAQLDTNITAIATKATEPYNAQHDSGDQVGTELTITHGRGRYPASIMLINETTGQQIGIAPYDISTTEFTVDFHEALTFNVRVVVS